MRLIKWLNSLIECLEGWRKDLIIDQLVACSSALKKLHETEKDINARVIDLKALLKK